MNRRKSTPILGTIALAAAAVAAVLALTHPFSSGGLSAAELKQAETARVASGTLRERFALLSAQHKNKCGLAGGDLDTITVDGRLQGSCCSAMVFGRYLQQVKGLQAYAAVNEIPADPYDISVRLARRLISLDDSIALSRVQQATYDRAVQLSDEHGPCCCHCWRWRAFEGQAKALITRHRYTAAQIAKVWSIEDGCGGSGA